MELPQDKALWNVHIWTISSPRLDRSYPAKHLLLRLLHNDLNHLQFSVTVAVERFYLFRRKTGTSRFRHVRKSNEMRNIWWAKYWVSQTVLQIAVELSLSTLCLIRSEGLWCGLYFERLIQGLLLRRLTNLLLRSML